MMLITYLKQLSFCLLLLTFTFGCSKEDEAKKDADNKESTKTTATDESAMENPAPEVVKTVPVEVQQAPEVVKTVPVEVQPASSTPEGDKFDIMKPLNGTDTCFMAVELIRDQGDVAMFKDLGNQILVKEDAVVGDNNKTYFGIIGKMLNEKKSIAEIRQTILDTCRKLQTPAIKPPVK